MAGATFGTRDKKNAKGKVKWYTTLSFDGQKTERFAGYKQADAYALGIKLTGEYNATRSGRLKGVKQPIPAALEKFLSRPGIQETTHDQNRANLEDFFATYPDVVDLLDIDKDAILIYLDDLKVKKYKDDKKYKDGYISIKLRVLKTFLNFCVEKGWLVVNPFPKKIIPKYYSKGHFFTENERVLLLAPTSETQPRLVKADFELVRAITIAFYQGWRESTVWEMDWKDYRKQDQQYFVRGIKGAKDKWVNLHKKTLEIMGTPKPSGKIFTQWASPKGLGLAFRRKRRNVLGEDSVGRFHDTKHTAVSMMEEQGLRATEIEAITNTSKAALVHYSHANKERLEKKYSDYKI